MDLKAYEHVKFELAELIRSGQLIASEGETDSNKRYEAEHPWRLLLTRLAEDRFTVVVAGRFSRGKSSLMNAVLGLDRLPTGIVPLTSVITYVRYGTSERVLLNYEGTRLRGEATLQELPDYVTEKGNPGNAKRRFSCRQKFFGEDSSSSTLRASDPPFSRIRKRRRDSFRKSMC
jgi:Dynamin family